MIDELSIEQSIVDHLSKHIEDVPVERCTSDVLDVLMRAKQSPLGLIEVMHVAHTINYEQVEETNGVYSLSPEFAITILINDNGSGRDDMINKFREVRDLMSNFEYPECSTVLVSHQIHPQKFPDMIEGVHMAELIIAVQGLYYTGE